MGNESSWKTLLFGAVAAALLSVFLIGGCAMLITAGVIPERAVDGCVLAACAAGSLVGSRMAVRGKGGGALMWGLGAAALTAAMFAVAGFFLYSALDLQRCAVVGGACLCGGGLAGAMGDAGRKKRRT